MSEEKLKKYAEVIKAFEEFCKPKQNEVYESFKFYNRNQEIGEPFDNFLLDVKKLVRNCGFSEEERMLRDRIVLGTIDKSLQKRLLETDKLDLAKTIDMAKAAELLSSQIRHIQDGPEISKQLNALNNAPKKSYVEKRNYSNNNSYSNKYRNLDYRDSNSCNSTSSEMGLNMNKRAQREQSDRGQSKITSCTYCIQKHKVRKCPAWKAKCK